MPYRCSIKTCRASIHRKPRLTFHRFPKKESLRKRWLDAIGLENINANHKSWCVCSLHFKDEHFNKTLNKMRLRDDVVPSVNLGLRRCDASGQLGGTASPPPEDPLGDIPTAPGLLESEHDTSTSSTQQGPKIHQVENTQNQSAPTATSKNLNSSAAMSCDEAPLGPRRPAALCRCCLSASGALQPLRARAARLYADVVGVPVDPEDRFPQHVCAFCMRSLRQLARFRARCLRVLELIFQTMVHGNEITMEYTQSLISKHQELKPQYSQTKPFTLEIPGAEVKDKLNEKNTYFPQLPFKGKVKTKENEDVVEKLREPLEKTATYLMHVVKENESLYEDDGIEYLDFDALADDLDDVKGTGNNEKKIKEEKKINEVTKTVNYWHNRNWINYSDNKTKRVMADLTERMGFYLTDLSLDDQIKEIEEKTQLPGIVCKLCGKRFQNATILNRHMHHHVLKPNSFVCDLCSYVFKYKNLLIEHMLSHRYVFSCKYCEFETRNNNLIKLHHASHQKHMCSCKYCGKVFMDYTTLCSHIKAEHYSELPWCDFCGKSFSGKKGVIRHKKLTHNLEDYPYTCACSKSFKIEAALDRHLKVDGCDLPSCAQCGESFPREELLKIHLVQRHQNGRRTRH